MKQQLKVNDFTYNFVASPGIALSLHLSVSRKGKLGRNLIKLTDIYTGQTEQNPGRVHGALRKNVSKIENSLRDHGVDYSLPVPVIEYLDVPIVANGRKYYYRLIDGMNRFKAFLNIGYIEWVFDVINIGVDGVSREYALETFAQIRNDHAPSEAHSAEDVHASATRLIGSGDLEDNENSIRNWVYLVCQNMPTQTKNQIVAEIIKNNDIPTATISWTDKSATAWAQQPDTNLPVEPDYFFPGHYFQDRIYSLCKQYSDTKKVQNIYIHVDGKDEKSIVKQREDTMEKFDNFEQIVRDVAGYLFVNGSLPFNFIGYNPQINDKEDPTTCVPIAA